MNTPRLLLDTFRPVLRHLPRGAGTLYRWLGGYRANDLWGQSGERFVQGVDHRFRMRLNLGNSFERETFYLGRFYEWVLLSVIDRLVRPGDTFIDAGANIGMITLHAAARVGPRGRIFCFEPNPEARNRLREHVSMNGLNNVTVLEKALGEVPTTATLTMAKAHTGTGTLRSLPTALRTYRVQVARLDDWAGEITEGRIFLKVDTEGYDFNVLKGARRLLDRPDVSVFAEINHRWLQELGQSADEMLAYMKTLGYNAFYPHLKKGLLRKRLVLSPLVLPGPHHWFNALFLHDAAVRTETKGVLE